MKQITSPSLGLLNTKYLQISNNLSDLTNAATARTNLGLVAGGAGDIWVEKAGDTMTGNLILQDDIKLQVGTDLDGNIYSSSGDLYIENDTSDKDIIFKVNDGGADTEVMRIDGSVSRVGIGTTAPSTALHVSGSGVLTVRRSDQVYGTIQNDDDTGYLQIWGGNINTNGAALYIAGDSWAGSASLGAGDLVISQGTSGNIRFHDISDNEHMRITSAGNVGIGTTGPGGTLDVAGEIRITSDDTFVSDVAQIYTTAADGMVITGHAGSTHDLLITEAGGQRLISNPTGTNDVLLVELSGGNVGIGTTGPGEKLDVFGDVKIGARASDTDSQLEFKNGTDVQARLIAQDFSTDGRFGILLNKSGTGMVERLSIERNSGNVGIGVTDPDTKLEVFNAGNQLKLSFDGTDNAVFAVDTAGDLTITPSGSYLKIPDDVVIPKTSGKGIRVDTATPTFGWRDITGEITNAGGANKPTSTTYRGGIDQFLFSAGDESIIRYHIPHDYVPGTDIHLHVHWSHISAIVTGGTLTFTAESSYAKGHNQAPFSAPVTGTFTGTASTTQYQHIVSEVQFSASSPSGLQLDTDDLEPDGVILIRLEMTTNNITSSGAVPDPFIHEVDVHYMTSNIGTKNNSPDFYA